LELQAVNSGQFLSGEKASAAPLVGDQWDIFFILARASFQNTVVFISERIRHMAPAHVQKPPSHWMF